MQDMATMQQHSITSPAPASTIQNQDSPMDSIVNANCDAQIHHEASRTGMENHEETPHTTKINNEVVEDATMNEESKKEPSSNKNQSNEDNETSSEISKNEISRTKSDRDADNENVEECQSLSEEAEMRYVCPICDTILSSQHDFTLHIRSHNNLSPVACVKTFTCKICSKVLSSSSSLDRHVLVHSGERPFKCRICGVAFTTNGNMHRHMRTHNSPTSKSESYESDGSTDSTGSFNSKKSPLSSPPPSNSVAKKRRVGNSVQSPTETNNNKSSGSISPPSCLSPNENGNKRKLPDLFPADAESGESPGRRRKATPNSHQDSPENLSDQSLHCPVCEREDFASLNVLETHLEESHPEYQIKCHVCEQIFKNHRVLNLHRSMAQHEKIDKTTKPKNNSQQQNNAVLGFKDLTFVDFSSKKFPHIAVAVCEKSMHKPSSTLKFQCSKCDRAFPCISALNIHQEADVCSDGDTPTDLTSNRRRISSAGESEEEIEERKREDFFAGLDLQNKSVPSSPSVNSDHYRPKKEDYEASLYYNPVNGERNDIGGRNIESGKDLADIQSIISVTSASGLIQDLSKSPPQMSTMSPDCGGRGSILDSGGGEEEQQDCFAAEFRRMKLKGEFPCRLCTAVFPNLRALKGHNRSHLSSSVGIFRCNMCPYSNPDKATTVRHMRNHNGDRPYECSLCNYAFTTKANCERHLRNRHSKLSREEVKKSIIYHPSEDPTNDPDLPTKLQSREDVKRSLVFSTQHSSSLEDLNSNEHSSSFQHSIDDHKKNYAIEENLSPGDQFEESRSTQSPHLSIVDRRVIDLKQVRPWEKTQEVATMTINAGSEETEEQETSRDSFMDRRTETNENISSIEALVNLTKNNNNPFPKLPVIENQRLQTKEMMPMSEISSVHHHMGSYPSPTSEADSPLDLSMDALDLSKKKDSYPKNFRSTSPTKDADDSIPQDLSTKSSQNNEYNNQRSPPTIFSAKSDQNLKGNSALPQQMLSSNSRGTTMSPQQHSPSPTAPTGLHPAAAGFYGNPQLNHLYLNNNGFPFHQTQPPFAIHPYFIPSTHAALIPSSNVDDFRSRLHKELINNLQLSGGTIFDSVMASAAERLQAFHQQAFQDYSRGKPEVKVEENRQPPVKELDKSTPNVVINKPAPVVKVSVAPKSVRERDNSSVKMVIKNGVLMPKQKQRRYRTERPFACEHCSARFTLRSNMERHIKQQHPQYWTQRQRSNVGGSGPGRRSHTIPTSLTANLNITNHQDTAMKNLHSDSENLLAQSKSPHIPTVINIPEPPTDYQISNVIRDSFHSGVSDGDKVILPKIKDELSSDSVLPDKTKDHSSVINNNNNNNNNNSNNNYNKAFISEEVKLAIAQQLKSKLNNPINPMTGEDYDRLDAHNQEDVKKGPDEDNDDENELIIDEEKEVEEETIEERVPKEETKEKFHEQNSGTGSSVKDVDLASVSRLLDNATTQTQAFQRYFRGTQDGEEGLEGSEEDEEGLVAGSNSEGNNSGSDENKSESEQSNTSNNNNNRVEKKKSAYSLAPNRVSCPYCFRKFPWSSSLRRHVLTHTGQKPYKCPHCPLLFTTKSNCDRHLLRKHGGQTGPAASQGGGSSSSSETSPGSNTNNYTMRNVPERPFKCNYCPSSTFSTQSNLKKHVQTKHSPTSPGSAAHPLIPRTAMSGDEGCNASTAGSSRPESRFGGDESHGSGSEDAGDDRGNAHSSSEVDHGTPRKHEKDERTSYLSAALESHRPLTSSSILEATVLGVKPYSSQTPSLPEPHSGTVSSADLPFKCHLCEGSYAERQEALEHIRENHPSEFELLMSKGALDSNFAGTEDNNNISSAVSHTDEGNAVGEESLEQLRGKFPDYANRKVMCAFCMRRFWSAEDLRRHMRTHTGERPFSCDICRRRFTLKHSMLRHRKKHNNSTALFNVSTTSSEDISVVSGDEDHPSSGTSLHTILQNRSKKQHASTGDDATVISGDEEPMPGSVINSDIAVGKPLKLALKMTNHNNNNITNTTAKGIKQWDGDSENFTASAAAKILSSKFSTVTSDRKEDADDDNTGTDLIGNLLGIQGSIIDKVLQSKSAADDAAKLLGVQNGANQE